jgi:prevent-host-death family protein
MVHLEDIHSLTDFQRNTKEHIQRLKETGRPEVLTVNGKAEIVVQDAASYQRLLELIDRAEAIEGIQKGLESMQRGEGEPAQAVFTRLRKKHNIQHDA